MRRLLLITTALTALGLAQPLPANAEPISLAVAAATGFSVATATALTQLGLSILLSAVSQALIGKPKSEVQRAELTRPAALPAYRYVYGTCWAPGTPVAWHVIGENLYICYLLNSRPSALTAHTVLFDKRPATGSGDPFDFASQGRVVESDPFFPGGWEHARYWIGRGDQTSCPDLIVEETEGHFAASDAWRGRTVLWARLRSGSQDDRAERWPATPPELNVEGNWSLIHDPRTGSYSASSNQALIVLDALRRNPIRPYSDSYLHLDTFAWASDVADQAVAVKGGGTIPRYRANGVLIWADGTELEDQIGPLLDAGSSRLVRVGGQLAIVPACDRAAVHTISDFTDGQPITMTRWQSGDGVYTEAVATYTAPDRAYESAEAPVHIVTGAQAADGGLGKRLDLQLNFVTDHRQAQRLAKIAVMRSRMQRQISGEVFPDAFKLVAGSVAAIDLPAPYTAWNGLYEVESIHPAAGVNDDESITLRLPIRLRETSSAIYAWNAATEEQTVEGAVLDPWVSGVTTPASLTLSTGGNAALITGSTVTPRVQLDWSASSASATRYEWQYQVYEQREHPHDGTYWVWSDWNEGGTTEARRAWIDAAVGAQYRARVRARGIYGDSGWRDSGNIIATGPTRVVAAPAILLAVGGAGAINLTLRQASDADAQRLELWSGPSTLFSAATLLETIPAGANVTVATAETGLGDAVTRYYWLRARDGLGNASGYIGPTSATTTP